MVTKQEFRGNSSSNSRAQLTRATLQRRAPTDYTSQTEMKPSVASGDTHIPMQPHHTPGTYSMKL